jgi:hypothetical protein
LKRTAAHIYTNPQSGHPGFRDFLQPQSLHLHMPFLVAEQKLVFVEDLLIKSRPGQLPEYPWSNHFQLMNSD